MKRVLLILCVVLIATATATDVMAELVSAGTTRSVVADCQAGAGIQAQLVEQGMSPVAAMELVEQMPAEDIVYFAGEQERNQAGGDAGGAIVFVLVVVVLVVLIVYLVKRT